MLCLPSSNFLRAFIPASLQGGTIYFNYQMTQAAKLQINAAHGAKTTIVAPKIQKIRQSMTVPAEARKLRLLCLHGYLQNSEVRDIIHYF